MPAEYFLSVIGLAILAAVMPQVAVSAPNPDAPNIVLILADDMGIDSVQALNEKSSIPPPPISTSSSRDLWWLISWQNAPPRRPSFTGSAVWIRTVCTPASQGARLARTRHLYGPRKAGTAVPFDCA